MRWIANGTPCEHCGWTLQVIEDRWGIRQIHYVLGKAPKPVKTCEARKAE